MGLIRLPSAHEHTPDCVGFACGHPESCAFFAPAAALAFVFALLPFCLLRPIDADRNLPLLFVLAALLRNEIDHPPHRASVWPFIRRSCAWLVPESRSGHSTRPRRNSAVEED